MPQKWIKVASIRPECRCSEPKKTSYVQLHCICPSAVSFPIFIRSRADFCNMDLFSEIVAYMGCLVALFLPNPIWIHSPGPRQHMAAPHKFHSLVNSERWPPRLHCVRRLLYAIAMSALSSILYGCLYVELLSYTEPWCDHLRPLNLCRLSPNIVIAVVKLVELDICKFWYQRLQLFGFQQIRGDANMHILYQYQRRQRWNRYIHNDRVMFYDEPSIGPPPPSGHNGRINDAIIFMRLYYWVILLIC